MERTSNSDIEILIKLYHTAEFDGALKIAFYLKNWLVLIPRNLDMSYTSIKKKLSTFWNSASISTII